MLVRPLLEQSMSFRRVRGAGALLRRGERSRRVNQGPTLRSVTLMSRRRRGPEARTGGSFGDVTPASRRCHAHGTRLTAPRSRTEGRGARGGQALGG